jgi:hypothetical protein
MNTMMLERFLITIYTKAILVTMSNGRDIMTKHRRVKKTLRSVNNS